MVVFNYSGKEINAKIVYYGPGLSGKTTNLERIYGQVPENRRGKMVSMKTRSDRTLFFDFLPVNAGEIRGFRTRFLLYTVPGQVHYNATRKLVLKGTDAIIFVADSDPALRQANIESLANLEQNLSEYQLPLDKIPVILQYNKRDLPNPLTIDELNADLNRRGWPWFEATAVRNEGVWETFRAATRALFENLERTLGAEKEKPGSGTEEKRPQAISEPAKPAHAPDADRRFDREAPVYDVGAAIDDVVRLSGTVGSWRETIDSSVKETESSARRETGGGARPPETRSEDVPKPAGERDAIALEPKLPFARGDSSPSDREGVDSGSSGSLPSLEGLVRREERPSAAERPVAAKVSEGGPAVVRVPVRIDEKNGVVRLEIVLEIRLEREKEAKAEALSLDSRGGRP